MPLPQIPRPTAAPLRSRRQFLHTVFGTVAVGSLGIPLASCGGDDGPPPELQALYFPSFVLAAGIDQRIPFGLIDQGVPFGSDDSNFAVTISKGGTQVLETEVTPRIVSHDHPEGDGSEDHQHSGLLRYFAVRATLDEPGVYDLDLTFDDRTATLPFQIFDPADVVVPLPGEDLPALRFPTFTNPMGMDPICTQFGGPCPLHDQTIDEALANGRPLALLIATPAFCATAYCGPVLDVMLELAPSYPDVTFLHADVYLAPNQADGDLLGAPKSPTVQDLALPFEPTLFLVAPDRTIIDRIDNVYDNTELRQSLDRL